VFKLYEAVDIHGHKFDSSLARQIAFYDDGVGTENFALLRIIGAAFGYGFAKNVRDLYTELVHVYAPDDKLFLFGFSRGAYTIRALAGMIQYCGVLQRDRFESGADLEAGVKVCWKAFEKAAFPRFITDKKRRAGKASADTDSLQRREKLGSHPDQADIEFLGVWDTVGAVGMPVDELKLLVNWICPRKFGELTPGSQVRRACHALSIDDERRTFHPELWNETDARPDQVEQVWFAGVHSNVGGGYPKQGLSLVALDWMMSEVEEHGLRFIPAAREYIRARQDVHDRLYDSRAGYAVYYRWDPRNIAKICQDHGVVRPKIHASVFERIANTTDGYAPGNIPVNLEITDTRDMPPRPQLIGEVRNTIRADLKKLKAESLQSLPDMRFWTWVGYLSYYGFLLLTIAAIYSASPPVQGLSLVEQTTTIGRWLWGLVTSITALVDVAKSLAATWWFLPGLLICYLVSFLVDNRMERRYSGFWHQIRALIDPWRVRAQEGRGDAVTPSTRNAP
jgi:hypothetical protein